MSSVRKQASVVRERVGFVREPCEARAADGWRLRGEWLVPPSPRAVVIAGHAMMVDRRTLDRPRGEGLVSHLARAGAAVLWPDLRGHGQSGPRADEGGDWGYDDLVADVPVLLDAARARFPTLPVFTVGHSLFGHVTLAHLSRHGAAVDGHVMLACNISNPTWRRRPLQRWTKGAAIRLFQLLGALNRGPLPVQRLKQGTDDEPPGYVADFVRGWRHERWVSRDGFDYYAALPSVRTPVLALVGAGDRLYCPPGDARDLIAALPHHTFEVVGRASGLPFDPGHMELVLDERCRPAWDRVATFVLSRASR